MTAIKDMTSGFGRIEYNGIEMGPLRRTRVVKFEPVLDDTRRATKWVRLVLNVLTVIQTTTQADTKTAMQNLVAALSVPRRRFRMDGVGLPDIDTNAMPDCNLGPRVNVISCTHGGGYLSFLVEMDIEYAMPALCATPSLLKSGSWLSMNFDTAYATNDEGLVERRISGYAEMLQVAGSEKNLETLWDKIDFTSPDWMRRVVLERNFNREKNRIDFVCVDAELSDLAYPDGIITAEVDEDLENRPPGFIQWYGQLSARLRTAPGYPRSLAADKFFLIMFDVGAKLRAAAEASNGIVIPERIRLGSGKFSRTSRFSVTWRMAACLHDVLQSTGLWEPVPGTSYKSWRASMDKVGVTGKRGVSNLRWNGQDVIVNLCGAQPSKLILGADTGYKFDANSKPTAVFKCADVKKEHSYLYFENRIRGAQSQNVLVHKLMQMIQPTKSATADPGNVSLFPIVAASSRPDVAQQVALSDDLVVMQGRALRIKYDPEIPHLEKVAGVEVQELARHVEVYPKAGYFDCPLMSARWAILYRAKKPLYGVKPPNNKQMCFIGGENDGRA